MKALDLFCGAGGASMGLRRAGFDVLGVDMAKQHEYPFEFVQSDAVGFGIPADIDFVWASPPCQKFSAYRRKNPATIGSAALNLIPSIRAKLEAWGGPYVIENVTGARDELITPVMLCGSSFGLDVRRHRLFEANFEIAPVACDHAWQTPRFPPATNRTNLRSTVEVGVWRIPLDVQQRAMGINWMTLKALSQAIPPAYSEYIANQWRATR